VDDGGPWYLEQRSTHHTFGTWQKLGSGTVYGQIATSYPTAWSTTPARKLQNSELDSFGTTAIARSAPTNPAFDLATALGELAMDGLPTAAGLDTLRSRSLHARQAGKEYLNVQFGWLPLISDVRKFAKTVKHSAEILDRYRKGSDQKIRVRYDGDANLNTKGGSYDNFVMIPSNSFGSGTIYEREFRRQWFSGAFRYHIPTSDEQLGKFREWLSMSDHLLGWKVTPETLWNIAPWTWATDWFANTGDIITNISNLGRDGLVLQYGYSMHTHSVESTLNVKFVSSSGSGSQIANCQRLDKLVYKQRREATPYGFGINLGALSTRQIAIIAALGLSKT